MSQYVHRETRSSSKSVTFASVSLLRSVCMLLLGKELTSDQRDTITEGMLWPQKLPDPPLLNKETETQSGIYYCILYPSWSVKGRQTEGRNR